MKKANSDVGHKPGAEVQNYLDFLLQEATSPFEDVGEQAAEAELPRAERSEPTPVAKPVAAKPIAPTPEEHQVQAQKIATRVTETKPVLERPRLLPQIAPSPLKVAEQQKPVAKPAEAKVETKVAVEPVVEPEPEEPKGVGSELTDPFQCLLFDVGTLKLAVPLVELGAICQMVEPLTPLFGQPEWYLGIYSVQGRNIKVVDTGHWVLQDRYTPEIKDEYQFLLTFPNVDWGLAVSSLHEAVHIQQSEVAWRAVRDTSPWMAGVVRKHMCALLDMQQFEHCFSHTQER